MMKPGDTVNLEGIYCSILFKVRFTHPDCVIAGYYYEDRLTVVSHSYSPPAIRWQEVGF
jgi:hypothetical protein